MVETFGKFVRNGVERIAYTPSDAVRFRFEGWEEVDETKAKLDTPEDGRAASAGGDDDSDAEHVSGAGKAASSRRGTRPHQDG